MGPIGRPWSERENGIVISRVKDGFQLVFYRFTMDWLTSDVTEPPEVSEGTFATERYGCAILRIPSRRGFNSAIGDSYNGYLQGENAFLGLVLAVLLSETFYIRELPIAVRSGWEMRGDIECQVRRFSLPTFLLPVRRGVVKVTVPVITFSLKINGCT